MEWKLGKAFALEATKRAIEQCDDIEKLRDFSLNLLLQNVALEEMTGQLLLRH